MAISPQIYVSVVSSGHQLEVLLVNGGDDTLVTYGDDNDGVRVLRSTVLAADAELTDVIVGTSDHQGVAANSLIDSVITANGDYILLVNNGGNSYEAILADASARVLYLGFGMTSVQFPKTVIMNTAGEDIELRDVDIELRDSSEIRTFNADGQIALIKARDSGVGLVQVASITGAADPFFGLGGADEFKFYYSGIAEYGGLTYSKTTAGITASTTQSQGQGALTSEINEVSICANINDTVTLPGAKAGGKCLVINNGAQTLQVFPASGDNLGAGLNTSMTIAAAAFQMFVAYDDTNWEQV